MRSLNTLSTVEEVQQRCRERKVPEYMAEGLWRYLTQGIPPGDFLLAVLRCDFGEMMRRADSQNAHAFYAWGMLLYNDMPFNSWGSARVVENWLQDQAKTSQKEPKNDSTS